MLWNPLKHQALQFRPEERIRLQVLEFLMLQSGIPSSRIAVESPVPSRFSRGRTDILCYDRQFQPLLLIECKAENVRLGPRAATQSAVYNRFVKAPFLMLTNGLEDALFHVAGKPEAVGPSDYPSGLVAQVPDWYSDEPEYWSERGFLNATLPAPAAEALARRLALLFHLSGETRSWLDISYPWREQPPAHHHLLLPAETHPDTLIAVSLRTVTPEKSVFTAVANRKKENTALFQCTIDREGCFRNPRIVPEPGANPAIDPFAPDSSTTAGNWTLPADDPDFAAFNAFWFSEDADPAAAATSPATSSPSSSTPSSSSPAASESSGTTDASGADSGAVTGTPNTGNTGKAEGTGTSGISRTTWTSGKLTPEQGGRSARNLVKILERILSGT